MKSLEVRDRMRTAIRTALFEDVGSGDKTTDATISPRVKLRGEFLAKVDGVISGLNVVEMVFRELDPRIKLITYINNGHRIHSGEVFAEVSGSGRAILTGERVALNFLQRMSGIATMTAKMVDAAGNRGTIILDTRKTAPGLRIFDRQAVRNGGGQNHRFGLFDMALIKDNHIVAAGGITPAVENIRREHGSKFPIEVEVTDMEELREAISLKPDRILLDNMNLEQISEAVEITAGRVPLEVSGGVTLETVGAIAKTGVDYISSGALTHSVKALDISLELTPKE